MSSDKKPLPEGFVAIARSVITFQVTRSESFGYAHDKLREES